jgi:hypothetical protein
MVHKLPIVVLKEGENPWVTYMRRQVLRKNNCINLMVTGKVGSAKSFSLLSQFCQVNEDFDLNTQCFFRAKDLIKFFRSDKKIKGRCFMFDESGIDASAHNWWDEINKGLSAFFQTSRHRNVIFGMTVPYMSYISKGVRKLMNCHWRAEGYSTLTNTSKIKPYVLEWNDDMEKFYRKRLLIRTPHGSTRCDSLHLPKPPAHIIKPYEKLKREFTNAIYEEIENKMTAAELKESRKGKINLTTLQERVLNALKEKKTVIKISQVEGIGARRVRDIIEALRKKGIKIQQDSGFMQRRIYRVDDCGMV